MKKNVRNHNNLKKLKKYYTAILYFVKQLIFQKHESIPGTLILLLLISANQLSFAQQTISCGKNKVLICHKGINTLCVSESAVQAHLDHGDYLGPCGNNDCGVSAMGGIITCIDSIVTLTAISNTEEVTYNWSGPDNFSSNLSTPATNIPGVYTVTITDTIQECSATDSASVAEDISPPGSVANGGTLTCANSSVILSGNSEIPDITFKWTGPDGFVSTMQNPETSAPGEYLLTVTNPSNGCMSGNTAIINQNRTAPQGVTATVQDMLTCARSNVTLTGSSDTTGVTYSWSGPNGYTSAEQNPLINKPGVYTLLVTDPENGCTSSANVLAEQDTSPPDDIAATVSKILTCIDTIVTLTGTSTMGNVSYNWSGPDNFVSYFADAEVSAPGKYTLTVTNPVNGCSDSYDVTVEQNIAVPGDLTATASDTLSCTVAGVMLSASSATYGLTYKWTGPQGFTSNEQNTLTVLSGNYTVAATDPKNSCTLVKQVTVMTEECP